jgi:uncharacterized membrane protein
MSTIFPSALLSLTPLFDIVGLITRNSMWARVAFWSAFIGVIVVAVALIPEVVDWLATDRHTRARRAGAAPLTVHLAALAPLTLGVFERLHLAAVTRVAATAALPSISRLDVWPMALAIAGALAWLVGGWMAEERVEERVRYQPTGLPFKA